MAEDSELFQPKDSLRRQDPHEPLMQLNRKRAWSFLCQSVAIVLLIFNDQPTFALRGSPRHGYPCPTLEPCLVRERFQNFEIYGRLGLSLS